MALNLDTRNEGVEGNYAIRPTLSLEIAFRGQNNVDLKNGETKISIKDPGNANYVLLHQGAIFLNTRLSQNQDSVISIDIALTYSDLERIEEIRGGNDLEYKIEGQVHGYDRRSDEFEAGSFTLEERVPRSDWAEMLRTFGYGDIQILELRFPDSPAREYFENAWAHIEKADDHFARGNWGETLTECRQAIEIIDNLERAEDVDDLIGEEKWDRMGSVKGYFSKFLSLGPHSEEGIGHEPIVRRDAQMSLLIAKALVNYVADAIRERDET